MKNQMINIKGKVFGRWTVVDYSHSNGGCLWKCKCSCGNESIVGSNALRYGKSKSCGCLKHDLIVKRKTTHNLYNTTTYHTWASMVQRCTNKKYTRYKDYGGRGITVCDKWLTFEGFYEDMGVRPDKLSLERKYNNTGYCKENCEWADGIKQANN